MDMLLTLKTCGFKTSFNVKHSINAQGGKDNKVEKGPGPTVFSPVSKRLSLLGPHKEQFINFHSLNFQSVYTSF